MPSFLRTICGPKAQIVQTHSKCESLTTRAKHPLSTPWRSEEGCNKVFFWGAGDGQNPMMILLVKSDGSRLEIQDPHCLFLWLDPYPFFGLTRGPWFGDKKPATAFYRTSWFLVGSWGPEEIPVAWFDPIRSDRTRGSQEFEPFFEEVAGDDPMARDVQRRICHRGIAQGLWTLR